MQRKSQRRLHRDLKANMHTICAIPNGPLHNIREGRPVARQEEEPEEELVAILEAEFGSDSDSSDELYEQRGMSADQSKSDEASKVESIDTPATGSIFSEEIGAAIEKALVFDFMQRLPKRFASWKAKA